MTNEINFSPVIQILLVLFVQLKISASEIFCLNVMAMEVNVIDLQKPLSIFYGWQRVIGTLLKPRHIASGFQNFIFQYCDCNKWNSIQLYCIGMEAEMSEPTKNITKTFKIARSLEVQQVIKSVQLLFGLMILRFE